jgi:hypothetical protein
MFGSGAIAALKTIWASLHIVTATGRMKYATHMLGRGLPFTWQSFSSKQKVRHLIANLDTLNDLERRRAPESSNRISSYRHCHYNSLLQNPSSTREGPRKIRKVPFCLL